MGDVIHLAHRNDSTDTDFVEYLACKNCKNKTWIALYEQACRGFPRLKCACCGQDGGLFGWVDEE